VKFIERYNTPTSIEKACFASSVPATCSTPVCIKVIIIIIFLEKLSRKQKNHPGSLHALKALPGFSLLSC